MILISTVLGALIKAFLEVEIAAILLKCILDVFLKKDSSVCRMLSFATEPVIYPARLVISKSVRISRLPIDMSIILSLVALSLLDILFGTWF